MPFVGDVDDRARRCTIVFAAFAIVAASNGVNITDGLDGLAGGTLVFAFVAFMIIALLNVPAPAEPRPALRAHHRGDCSASCGSTSTRPRSSWATRARCRSGRRWRSCALITGQILVLPLIGLIFVVETGSVIIQVAYFKATGGKRIFRMSPIHHHFELAGWDEEKITAPVLDRRRSSPACSA